MIWRNFVVAVWASIIWSAARFAQLATHVAAVNEVYGPFSPRVYFFPIVVGGGQLFLWARVYRNRDGFARWMAGFVAGFFLLQLLIMGLQASVQLRPSGLDAALFAYFAVSHGLFAFGARSYSSNTNP